ncbi:MAG TPA: efflux RND transporter permease subunit [Spirochaetota bacterium]|nr:efflux RND transporter permease subunit [Spirochaetota bacterium]HPR47671.1 efflux RND transporter permease subunit [Spirochaetota bacterium]
MNRYIDFIQRYPKSILLALIAITVIMGTGIPRLTFDNSVDIMMPQRDPEYLYYEKVKDIYGNIGKFVIMNITSENIWTETFLREADNLVTDIEEYKDYDEGRESARLAKLEGITAPETTREQVLEHFSGDPCFQRALNRAMNKLYKGSDRYSRRMMAALTREIRRTADIKKRLLVERILSPLTAKDISGKDDTLRSIDLIPLDEQGRRIIPATAAEIEAFKKRLTKNPAFERGLYSANDRRITDFCVLVNLANKKKQEDMIAREIWDIGTSYTSMTVTPHGFPTVNKVMNDYMRSDFYTFLPLTLLMVAIVFFLNFGSIRGVLLPFMTLVMTDVWTMGLMGFLGKSLTIVGISMPVLLVAVGSSYSIHILNQYYIDLDYINKKGKRKGLKWSMEHIASTVVLAGLTTLLGFLSLMTNQVIGIREWGLFSALGVLFAVLIATSLIPAALMLMPQGRASSNALLARIQSSSTIDAFIARITALSTRHHRAVIAVVLAVLIASVAGMFRLRVETAFMSFFKENDFIRVSSRLIGEKYGGSSGMSILIDSGRDYGVYDPAFLRTIDRVRGWLMAKENDDLSIGRTDGFTDVIKTMNMAVNNDDPAYYRVPDREVDVLDFMEIYSGDDADSDGRIDDFEAYIDRHHRTAMIFAKIWEGFREYHSTSDLLYIQDRIDRYLKENLPQGYSHRISGEPAILIKLADYITTGQLMSLLFSLIAVSLIIVLLFKNWKAGIVAMIPMSTAVIINFGIMGWFGIRLDSATAIIASITIGIGVDDTIHFLNTFRHYREHDFSLNETIAKILAVSGKAIIYTSLALIMGFSILSMSNFKPIILFGILSSLTMIATTAGALIVLPSVIKATGLDLKENPSESRFWRYLYIGRFFTITEAPDSEYSEE